MSKTTAARGAISQLLIVMLGIVAIPISSAAAPPPLPTWPQTFSVNATERNSFGLPVTAAGAVGVSVHAQGAPILVTLIRPDGTLAQQVAGTGDLRMSYAVTPAEVATSPLWRVGITLQQAMPGATASGSVEVQELPIDVRAWSAFLANMPKRTRARPDAKAMAATAAEHQAKIDATKREFEQARAARQAALLEPIRPRFEAAKARAAQAQTVSTRGLVPPTAVLSAPTLKPPVIQPLPIARPPASPAPPPPPAITLPLYTDQGEPGDPIVIAGSGFGGVSGSVHFHLGTTPWTGGASADVVAPVSVWTENEIFVTVPIAVGYSAAAIVPIYVVRADGAASTPVPFTFHPTMDLQVYPTPPQTGADSIIPRYDAGWCQFMASVSPQGYPVYGWANDSGWLPCDGAGDILSGHTSDDLFFQTVQLQNGWVVDHVDLTPRVAYCMYGPPDCPCGAYVSQTNPPRIGSNNPVVDVRVWVDACWANDNNPGYSLDVYVRGGKGVPFQ